MPDPKTGAAADAEKRIAAFFAPYDPRIAKLGKTLRRKLRDRAPGLHELVYVYEKQDSLVFSYSPTEQGAAGVYGLSIYPDRVQLFLAGGAALAKADPQGLLQGSGAKVRFVVIRTAADFARPEIAALLDAAWALAKPKLAPGVRGAIHLKADAQRKRARAAAAAPPRTASKRRKPPRGAP